MNYYTKERNSVKMADEKPNDTSPPAEVEQLTLEFPSPDDFPSYDDTDSDEGQAELADDSFDEAAATDDEVDNEQGCGCSK